MTNNKELINIAERFAENGYIVSNNGFKQYMKHSKTFVDVNSDAVLDILKRLYPNFERKPVTTSLLTPYLPTITDKDFETYNKCKNVINNKIDADKLNKEVNKIVRLNNNKKNDKKTFLAGDIKGALQILINNDIYTDKTLLYKYTGNDFKRLNNTEFIDIVKKHSKIVSKPLNPTLILRYALSELTSIKTIIADLNKQDQENQLNNNDWKNYNRINDIIKSYY